MLIQRDMIEILEKIEKRRDELLKEIHKIQRTLEGAPVGKLKVSFSHGRISYYHRSGMDKSGTYIPKSELRLIKSLAQSEYNQKALAEMEKEVKALNNCLDKCNPGGICGAVSKIPQQKLSLITPRELSNDQYIQLWKSKEYYHVPVSNSFDHYTKSGIHVRSKSECMIGDGMDAYGIPYRYEYPLEIMGREWHPDFNCLNPRTLDTYYWEHFGMMSEINYCNDNVEKIKIYAANGYVAGVNMIYTFETMDVPLTNTNIIDVIDMYLT